MKLQAIMGVERGGKTGLVPLDFEIWDFPIVGSSW